MVLAAGEGRRLRPWTADTPKPLLSVGGRPLLAHTLHWLERQGFGRIVLNTHHLAGRIETWLDAHRADYAADIVVSHEERLLGTGGGIRRAQTLWQADAAWIINGDVVCDLNFAAFETCLGADDLALMVLREDPRAASLGAVYWQLSGDGGGHPSGPACGRVVGLLDRGEPLGPPRMFTGIHLLRAEAARRLAEPSCVVRQGYLRWLEEQRVAAVLHPGYWNEIGTPERLAEVRGDWDAGALDWLHPGSGGPDPIC